MDTNLPMTTEQLIEACENRGITVSVTQLGRWVREGLIPDSLRRRHGLGRGMGTEWLWEAECLPRVMLIGHALAAGDRSFQNIARTLAETGYAPTASRLRTALLDCLAAYEQLMTIRQTYLNANHPQAEKRKRLTKHMRRKMPDMPDSVFDPFSACIGALLGVIPPDDSRAPESVKQLQQFFSIPALRHSLETIDASVLLEKYEEAGRMIPTFVPVLVGGVNWFLLPLLKQQLQKEGRETSALPISINLEAIRESILQEGERTLTSQTVLGKLRLYFAIALTVLPAENTTLFIQLYLMLQDIVSQLLDYLGISPGLFTSLLESGNASSVTA